MAAFLILDLNAQADGSERHRLGKIGRQLSQPDQIFFVVRKRSRLRPRGPSSAAPSSAGGCSSGGRGKRSAAASLKTGGFEAGEELLRAGDAAEGGDRAVDGGNFHRPLQPPDRPLPAPTLSSASNSGSSAGMAITVARRMASSGSRRLPAGSSRSCQSCRSSSRISTSRAKLAMLKAIIEQMNDRRMTLFAALHRIGFGQQTGVVAPGSHIDRNACLARNQQRLVAELLGASLRVDAGGKLALAAIASAEHIHTQPARGEGLGQGDGERRLARAAGGEIADADDREAQPPHRLQPRAAA